MSHYLSASFENNILETTTLGLFVMSLICTYFLPYPREVFGGFLFVCFLFVYLFVFNLVAATLKLLGYYGETKFSI